MRPGEPAANEHVALDRHATARHIIDMTDLSQDIAAWNEGFAHLVTESGGVLAVVIVRPPDIPALFDAARAGDREATRLISAVTSFIERVNAAAPVQCGSCDVDLADTPFSVVIALPSRDDPTKGVALGVCVACAIEHDEILARAMMLLRQVFPGLRRVETQGHEAGHA
jgi:hypothetical protein